MEKTETFVSAGEAETEAYAAVFAKTLRSGDVVCFTGGLGAGKTAFVRGAVSVLCPGAHVCSPTYSVMNEYTGKSVSVCHFDMYRIHGDDDLESVGFDDQIFSDKIVFVEWSENVRDFLPKKRIEVTVTKNGESGRTFRITRLE